MTIIHCPRCGDALSAEPKVNSATVQRGGVQFVFANQWIDHECEEDA